MDYSCKMMGLEFFRRQTILFWRHAHVLFEDSGEVILVFVTELHGHLFDFCILRKQQLTGFLHF